MFSSVYSSRIQALLSGGFVALDARGVARYLPASGRQPGSIAGGLHPVAAEVLSRGGISGDGLMARQLTAISTVGQNAQVLSGLAAGASILSCGVSIAGFAVMCRKLNQTNRGIQSLLDGLAGLETLISASSGSLFSSLVAHDICARIAESAAAGHRLLDASMAAPSERVVILAPVLAQLDRDIAFLGHAFDLVCKVPTFELAFEIFKAHALAVQTAVHGYCLRENSRLLKHAIDGYRRAHMEFRQRLAGLLLGDTPGLVHFADPLQFPVVARSFCSDLSHAAAIASACHYSHQSTNAQEMALLTTAGVKVLLPHALDTRDPEILRLNFARLAAITHASDLLGGSFELAPLRVGNLTVPGHDDVDGAVIEFLPERSGGPSS